MNGPVEGEKLLEISDLLMLLCWGRKKALITGWFVSTEARIPRLLMHYANYQ